MVEAIAGGNWGPTVENILKSKYPLHFCCRNGDLTTLASLLLNAQHSVLEEDSFYGWTPTHWAAYFGKLSCMMNLLDYATTTNCYASDASSHLLKQTPAHIAAFVGHSHCLKWLLHCGASLNKQDYLGETAIHKACRGGSIECISLLSSHGARILIKNNNGQTAAEVAELCGFNRCAEYLENAAKLRSLEENCGSNNTSPVHKSTQPSPLDVTARPFKYCHLDLAQSAEQMMEDFDDLNGHCYSDITINPNIASNIMAVGGVKRTWDNSDEPSFKRIRHTDAYEDDCNALYESHPDDDMMDATDSSKGFNDQVHQSTMTPHTMRNPSHSDLLPSPVNCSQMLECAASPTKQPCNVGHGTLHNNRIPIHDAEPPLYLQGCFSDTPTTRTSTPFLPAVSLDSTSVLEHTNSVIQQNIYQTMTWNS